MADEENSEKLMLLYSHGVAIKLKPNVRKRNKMNWGVDNDNDNSWETNIKLWMDAYDNMNDKN